ncbi:MAG: ABC transporter permease, partial [Eubacteriales bacterium]
YGTSLLRNHAMNGVFKELESVGFPAEVIKAIRDSVDCNLYFFEKGVSVGGMYAVVGVSVAVLIVICVLLNVRLGKKIR